MEILNCCRLCLQTNVNLVCVFDSRLSESNNLKDLVFKVTNVNINRTDNVSQKICRKCGEYVIQLYEFRQQSIRNDFYLKEQYKMLHSEKKPHHSIQMLFNIYPELKLIDVPKISNISPVVEMEMDAVENYFAKRNINFKEYSQNILRAERQKIRENKMLKKFQRMEKSSVSPISIKFREDKLSYEIVKKRMICEQKSDSNYKKRRLTNDEEEEEEETNKKIKVDSISPTYNKQLHKVSSANIISNIVLKPADVEGINEDSSIPQISEANVVDNSIDKNDCDSQSDLYKYLGLIRLKPPVNLNTTLQYPDFESSSSEYEPTTPTECQELLQTEIELSPIELKPTPYYFSEIEISEEFYCNFCKESFDSLEKSSLHLDVCYTRKAIEVPSYVFMENIDNNVFLKTKYRKAFDAVTNTSESDESEFNIVEEKPILNIIPQVQIQNSAFPDIDYQAKTSDVLNKLVKPDKCDQNEQTDFSIKQIDLTRLDAINTNAKGLIKMDKYKQYLDLYKIPIQLHHGDDFKGNFSLDKKSEECKCLKDWNDLNTITLKPKTEKSSATNKTPKKPKNSVVPDLLSENFPPLNSDTTEVSFGSPIITMKVNKENGKIVSKPHQSIYISPKTDPKPLEKTISDMEQKVGTRNENVALRLPENLYDLTISAVSQNVTTELPTTSKRNNDLKICDKREKIVAIKTKKSPKINKQKCDNSHIKKTSKNVAPKISKGKNDLKICNGKEKNVAKKMNDVSIYEDHNINIPTTSKQSNLSTVCQDIRRKSNEALNNHEKSYNLTVLKQQQKASMPDIGEHLITRNLNLSPIILNKSFDPRKYDAVSPISPSVSPVRQNNTYNLATNIQQMEKTQDVIDSTTNTGKPNSLSLYQKLKLKREYKNNLLNNPLPIIPDLPDLGNENLFSNEEVPSPTSNNNYSNIDNPSISIQPVSQPNTSLGNSTMNIQFNNNYSMYQNNNQITNNFQNVPPYVSHRANEPRIQCNQNYNATNQPQVINNYFTLNKIHNNNYYSRNLVPDICKVPNIPRSSSENHTNFTSSIKVRPLSELI